MEMIIVVAVIAVAIIFIGNLQMKKKEKKDKEIRIAEEKERAHNLWLMQLMQVSLQALAVGNENDHKAAEDKTYKGPLPKYLGNNQWTSIYDNLLITPIAGMKYRGNLSAYIGDFKGMLVEEPNNEYDPNSIMVKCEDGKHLGYIPEDLTTKVRLLIGEGDHFKPYRVWGIIENGIIGEEPFVGVVYIVGKK